MDTIIGIFRNQYVCIELPFAFIVKKTYTKQCIMDFCLLKSWVKVYIKDLTLNLHKLTLYIQIKNTLADFDIIYKGAKF